MYAALTESHDDLVDRLMLMSLYCDWRNECAEVAAAYEHFSGTHGPERPVAFAAYVAALDREECAASAYEAHIGVAMTLQAIKD